MNEKKIACGEKKQKGDEYAKNEYRVQQMYESKFHVSEVPGGHSNV
jgi:hypothetical protein